MRSYLNIQMDLNHWGLERMTGLEPATPGLGSQYSTIELHPRKRLMIIAVGVDEVQMIRASNPPVLFSRKRTLAKPEGGYAKTSIVGSLVRFGFLCEEGSG